MANQPECTTACPTPLKRVEEFYWVENLNLTMTLLLMTGVERPEASRGVSMT